LAVAAEREEFGSDGFGGGDEPDGWAPPVSRQRERGGAGWAAGFWAKMAEKRKGKRNPFLFFKQIFHSFSKWIFNQFDICFQNTHHIKECSSMNAT
jgi:hypothetical protein